MTKAYLKDFKIISVHYKSYSQTSIKEAPWNNDISITCQHTIGTMTTPQIQIKKINYIDYTCPLPYSSSHLNKTSHPERSYRNEYAIIR